MIGSQSDVAAYLQAVSTYDEAVTADGRLQQVWEPFLQTLEQAPLSLRKQWRERIREDLREDGLTFTVAQEESVGGRLEDMDPVPWIFSARAWQEVEEGIRQRARLLEAVVRDLLGERTLISRGLLPAELIFTDPGYLRPCVGLEANMGAYLFHYAADMARGPDGRMWVVEDRAQAPSGAGYALETRTILGRMFPQWVSRMNVRRLAPYFRAYRESLMSQYRGRRLEPRAVILTPGPYSATYFEHAYLAAYLGYTLVQGDDLVVRDGGLKLKTLEGLESVDILIRRIDAEYLDPLELRRDSFLGVAGVLGTMRKGGVACVNHPGCGLLENRGLSPFLPQLCKELLGEELLLPSAATWWCGQPKEREYVLANLDTLIVKPIQRNPYEGTVDPSELSSEALTKLRNRILSHPEGYVGQERIGFSSVPMLVDGHLQPRATVLRAFATGASDGYQVMPGGLARSAKEPGSQRVSMRKGGVIKDVWVLGEGPENYYSLWQQNKAERGNDWFTGVFTSRSAENLFWVGRYAERLVLQVRMCRGLLELEDSTEESGSDALWLLERLERLCDAPEPKEPLNWTQRYHRLLKGGKHVQGVRQTLKALLLAAYAVRDIWSQDCWRILTSMEAIGEACCDTGRDPSYRDADLERLSEKLYAFMGLSLGGMTRESGWNMLMVGRSLEAGLGLCELVSGFTAQHSSGSLSYSLMEKVLRLNENLITYRRHYRTTPEPGPMLELMLTSDINPRSLVHHLGQVLEQIYLLPKPAETGAMDPALVRLKQLRSQLQDSSPSKVVPDPNGILEMRRALEQAGERLSVAYFRHGALRALEDY